MSLGKYFPNGWYASFIIRQMSETDNLLIEPAFIYQSNFIMGKNDPHPGIISLGQNIIDLKKSDRENLTHIIPIQKDPGENWVEYLHQFEERKNADPIKDAFATDNINYFGNDPTETFENVAFSSWNVIYPEKIEEHGNYEININIEQIQNEENIKKIELQKEYWKVYNQIKELKLIPRKSPRYEEAQEQLVELLKDYEILKQLTKQYVNENEIDNIGTASYELGYNPITEVEHNPIRDDKLIYRNEIYFERRDSGKFMFKTYRPNPENKPNEPIGWDRDALFGTDLEEPHMYVARPHCVIFFAPYKQFEKEYNMYTIVDHKKFMEKCKDPNLITKFPEINHTRCEIIYGTDQEVQPFMILSNNLYQFDLIIKSHNYTRIFNIHYNNHYHKYKNAPEPLPGALYVHELDPKIYSELFNIR